MTKKHEFVAQRSTYRVHGIKGTSPSEQWQTREEQPKNLQCKICGKLVEAVVGTEEVKKDATVSVAWRDMTLIPKDAADVKDGCGEVVTFWLRNKNLIGGDIFKIGRALLEQKQPNSVLTHLMTTKLKDYPIDLTDVDKEYFPFVLEYIRNESVDLPFSKFKDYFISQLTSLKISFDPDKMDSLYSPSVMALAVLANKERLQGFEESIVQELTKNAAVAKKRLDAARLAYDIVSQYIKEHDLKLTMNSEEVEKMSDDWDFRVSCNFFLEILAYKCLRYYISRIRSMWWSSNLTK